MALTLDEKGELRWAVLGFLYDHQASNPWPEDALLRLLLHERRVASTEVTRQDLREALAMLQGFLFVQDVSAADPLNAMHRWIITADGVITHERKQ